MRSGCRISLGIWNHARALAALWVLAGICLLAVAGELRPVQPAAPSHARILVVEDSSATSAFRVHAERVKPMLEKGLVALLRTNSASAAWRSIVRPSDIVGIKV